MHTLAYHVVFPMKFELVKRLASKCRAFWFKSCVGSCILCSSLYLSHCCTLIKFTALSIMIMEMEHSWLHSKWNRENMITKQIVRNSMCLNLYVQICRYQYITDIAYSFWICLERIFIKKEKMPFKASVYRRLFYITT